MRCHKEVKYVRASCHPGVIDSALAHGLVPLIVECFGFMESAGSRWLRDMFRDRPDCRHSCATPINFLVVAYERCVDIGGAGEEKARSSLRLVFLLPLGVFFFHSPIEQFIHSVQGMTPKVSDAQLHRNLLHVEKSILNI
mmetsp:Transcript_28909/g.112558  ORF Transcript_28909/g.112558 Transcript_28909/m.112558 type:complete len:140 (-) Transcript_28909:225-644(-)